MPSASEPPSSEIRQRLLLAAEKLTSHREDAEQILLQCADYFRGRHLLHRYAQEVGIELAKGYTDENIQLYYQLRHDGDIVGFISKGWEEPYYRLGESLRLKHNQLPAWKRHAAEISLLLATNGVALCPDWDKASAAQHLNLTINIPEAGFNKDTLAQTVETMAACVHKIKRMITCD